MRLDPQECRLYALTCKRLTVRSKAPLEKDAYADLANKWPKLVKVRRPQLKSALCLIADVLHRGADFRFVPAADMISYNSWQSELRQHPEALEPHAETAGRIANSRSGDKGAYFGAMGGYFGSNL
jgi:hypothetical protein